MKIVKSELVYLQEMYDEIPSDRDLGLLDQSHLIMFLSECQGHYYKDFPEMEVLHRDILKAQFEAGAESTTEQREEELGKPFLSLCDAVKNVPILHLRMLTRYQ